MARYQTVQEQFERLDGFTIRARAEGILFALGFSPEQLEHKVMELSGGQKCRVMLAKAILQGQDLLLLDEPTNHLDLPSLRWLESFINDTQAAVAVISHDRYFLDRIATSILEIELGRSRSYEGNYTDFMEKKEQELEIAERHFERQQDYIKKQEEYIRRNIAGQNTKMARGRRTHLGKLAAPGQAAQGPPPDQVLLPRDPAQRRHRPGAGQGHRGLGRQGPVRAPGALPGQARPEAGHRRPERHRQVHPAQGHHRRDRRSSPAAPAWAAR